MTHPDPIRSGISVFLLLCCVFAPSALAATCEVVGPAGAEVLIDGEVLGVLPLAAPLDLPHDTLMELQVRKRGFVTHAENVFMSTPETVMHVEVDLLPLSRSTAMISSAFLAGAGQLYQGRRKTGWIMVGTQVAAWASVATWVVEFQSRRDDYLALDQQYREARVPAEILRLREERDQAWSDVGDAKNWRNASVGAVIAIAAYSVFDAWRGHNAFFSEVEPATTSLDGATTLKVGLGWSFGGGGR